MAGEPGYAAAISGIAHWIVTLDTPSFAHTDVGLARDSVTGQQYAFANRWGRNIHQTLPESLTIGATYQAGGQALLPASTKAGRIQLIAGYYQGNQLYPGSQLLAERSFGTPDWTAFVPDVVVQPGQWTPIELAYTCPPGSAAAGMPLIISFRAESGSNGPVFIDNVFTGVTPASGCTLAWQVGEGLPGVGPDYAVVQAIKLWDSDGGGPLAPRLVIGGRDIQVAGTTPVSNIAIWDGASWSSPGSGVASAFGLPYIAALTTLETGELVVGGNFGYAGGNPVRSIATWNGVNWASFGGGVDGYVLALAKLPSGDLIAGGYFISAGTVPANRIARWDGTNWHGLGQGMDSAVHALAVLQNGDLIAGGSFTTAGGVPASGIARWDGTGWWPVGSGVSGQFSTNEVSALVVESNGGLVAGGSFEMAGGVPASSIARWNGTSWSSLGQGLEGQPGSPGRVNALAALPSGDIVATGSFTLAGGIVASSIAKWNGTQWSRLSFGLVDNATGNLGETCLVLPSGELVVGGNFKRAGTTWASSIARWNGQQWLEYGSGMNDEVLTMASLAGGHIIASGNFRRIGNISARNIARWDGATWTPLGAGLAGSATCVKETPQGELIVGGGFYYAGDVQVRYIARWDGATWHPLGGGMNSVVNDIEFLPNGDLVAGGAFWNAGGIPADGIARWNGSVWQSIGNGFWDEVTSIVTLPNGKILAAGLYGNFPAYVCGVALWDGTAWTPRGGAVTVNLNSTGEVNALINFPGIGLVAAGRFTHVGQTPINNIAWYSNSEWFPLGGGLASGSSWPVRSLLAHPYGELVALGEFEAPGGRNAARWNGSSWKALATDVDGRVNAAAPLPGGGIMLGGNFTTIDGALSAFWARGGGCFCYANCDKSLAAPLLTPNDFQCFLNSFAAGSAHANCDGSTATPLLSPNDFVCFINAYAGGCN